MNTLSRHVVPTTQYINDIFLSIRDYEYSKYLNNIDLRVEHVDEGSVMGAITTELPNELALKTGESLEVFPEEILYKTGAK